MKSSSRNCDDDSDHSRWQCCPLNKIPLVQRFGADVNLVFFVVQLLSQNLLMAQGPPNSWILHPVEYMNTKDVVLMLSMYHYVGLLRLFSLILSLIISIKSGIMSKVVIFSWCNHSTASEWTTWGGFERNLIIVNWLVQKLGSQVFRLLFGIKVSYVTLVHAIIVCLEALTVVSAKMGNYTGMIETMLLFVCLWEWH